MDKGLDLYEQTVQLIGPVPEQYECMYFIGMIAILFAFISIVLFPYVIFRRR